MRLPRFRLRTLMIAVAVAAILSGTWVRVERRRREFSRLAEWHGTSVLNLEFTPKEQWHFDLYRKYERAARYPWLPVPPDPPEPK